MRAPGRWQVLLGRLVAPLAAIGIVGGLLTLLAALLLSLAPSIAISDVRPILLAGGAMCVGGVAAYLVLACLVSWGRGQGLLVAPCQTARTPIVANDRRTDDSSGAASGASEADGDGMPRWDRLSPPERTSRR